MNLVTTIRLDPEDPRQLLALIEHFNHACNALSKLAFESKTCGFAGAADTVAAQNIRARARGDAPMVADSLQRQVPSIKG